MSGNYRALEAARLARDSRDMTKAAYTLNESRERSPRYDRNDYAVARVYESGRPNEVVAGGTGWTKFEAEARAGQLRDAMTDKEIGDSLRDAWSYEAVTVRGTARVRKAFIPQKRVVGKLGGPG